MAFMVLHYLALIHLVMCLDGFNSSQNRQHENSAPEVKIIEPEDQSRFKWNSIVPYAITVSDPEDGKSEYEEIQPGEVLLEVTYLEDPSLVPAYLKKGVRIGQDMLRSMAKSNCLTCHAAKTKLIGPSFDLIANRYQNREQSIEMLANKLITGSTGVWGDVPMPPHPNLKSENAKEMIRWILNIGTISNYSFYTGTEGSFKTQEKRGTGEVGVYVLTATYSDHGLKGVPGSTKQGQHTLILKPLPD